MRRYWYFLINGQRIQMFKLKMIDVLKQDSNKHWIKQNMSIQDFHEKFLRDRDDDDDEEEEEKTT